MKINDNERREISTRLRDYESLRETFRESPLCAFLDVLGVEGYIDWNGVVNLLADLIEPEPERTCHMTEKGPEFVFDGWWECSECGLVYPPCNEEIAKWALQYCPHCGAKVVEDER